MQSVTKVVPALPLVSIPPPLVTEHAATLSSRILPASRVTMPLLVVRLSEYVQIILCIFGIQSDNYI